MYDWFEDKEYCGYSMEWIKYPDIKKWGMNLEEREKYDVIQKVLIEILEGIKILHKNGIIHNDLKPSHIFVGDDLKVKIIDPSIDRELITPEYAAPEVFLGKIGTYSDIYSIGLIFYEILTGEEKYYKDITEILKTKKEKISIDDEKIKGKFKYILKKMLEPDIQNRYRNVDSIICDFYDIPLTIETKFIPFFAGRKRELEVFRDILEKKRKFYNPGIRDKRYR